jgi:hypothetical protein
MIAMKSALSKGEEIIMDGAATRQKGGELVGGHLYLTPTRLVFESRELNVRNGTTVIEIEDIAGAESSFPNVLKIQTSKKEVVYFSCWKRKEWVAEIENLKKV